jgi:putative nucleotidyltransferase with HDIG domain
VKRILFVDDEPRVLEALENMLFDRPDDWEVLTAPDGEAALKIMEGGPVDVLVTDMRMPGMDGSALLEEVCRRYPSVLRLVLTGHVETKPLLQALAVSHQVLLKPCSPEVLRNTIQRVFELDRILASEKLRALVNRLPNLPARPKLYYQISALLAQESTSLKEVAELIETDVVISAKLLQLANSAFFYRGSSCSSIQGALSRLGVRMIQGVLLELEVGTAMSAIPEAYYEWVNNHSRVVADLARKIGSDFECADEAFVAGILHDIGRLLFALVIPDEYVKFLNAKPTTPMSPGREVEERERFGVTHAELGAYLLGIWGMPYPIIEAVAHHHHLGQIESVAFGALESVQVASQLVDLGALSPEEMAYLERLGMAGRLEGWQEDLEQTKEALTP